MKGGIFMEQKKISIKEFNALINNWTGKEIKILKHETNDLDETILLLDHVAYKENLNRIDDYEPKYELRLIGTGFVETENNDFEPLPESTYEIALDDNTVYQFDGSVFHLDTERGTYSIKLISPTE